MPVNYTGGGRNRNVLHTSKRQIDATGTPSLQARQLKRRQTSTNPYGTGRMSSSSRIKSRWIGEQVNGSRTTAMPQFDFAFARQAEVGPSKQGHRRTSSSTNKKLHKSPPASASPPRRASLRPQASATADLGALRHALLAQHDWAQLESMADSEPSEEKSGPSSSPTTTTVRENSDLDTSEPSSCRTSSVDKVVTPSNSSRSRQSRMRSVGSSDVSMQESAAATHRSQDTVLSTEILEFSSEPDATRVTSLTPVEKKQRVGDEENSDNTTPNDHGSQLARPGSNLDDLSADFAASAHSFYSNTLQAFGLSPPRIQYHSLRRAGDGTARSR